MDALNQLEEGLKDNIKKLSSFDKYKQEVLLGHLDWSPMHKDPAFWRENITNFEENDFQVCSYILCFLFSHIFSDNEILTVKLETWRRLIVGDLLLADSEGVSHYFGHIKRSAISGCCLLRSVAVHTAPSGWPSHSDGPEGEGTGDETDEP